MFKFFFIYVAASFCLKATTVALTPEEQNVVTKVCALTPEIEQAKLEKSFSENRDLLKQAHIVWRLFDALMREGSVAAIKLHDKLLQSGYARDDSMLQHLGYHWGGRSMNKWEEAVLKARFVRALAVRNYLTSDYMRYRGEQERSKAYKEELGYSDQNKNLLRTYFPYFPETLKSELFYGERKINDLVEEACREISFKAAISRANTFGVSNYYNHIDAVGDALNESGFYGHDFNELYNHIKNFQSSRAPHQLGSLNFVAFKNMNFWASCNAESLPKKLRETGFSESEVTTIVELFNNYQPTWNTPEQSALMQRVLPVLREFMAHPSFAGKSLKRLQNVEELTRVLINAYCEVANSVGKLNQLIQRMDAAFENQNLPRQGVLSVIQGQNTQSWLDIYKVSRVAVTGEVLKYFVEKISPKFNYMKLPLSKTELAIADAFFVLQSAAEKEVPENDEAFIKQSKELVDQLCSFRSAFDSGHRLKILLHFINSDAPDNVLGCLKFLETLRSFKEPPKVLGYASEHLDQLNMHHVLALIRAERFLESGDFFDKTLDREDFYRLFVRPWLNIESQKGLSNDTTVRSFLSGAIKAYLKAFDRQILEKSTARFASELCDAALESHEQINKPKNKLEALRHLIIVLFGQLEEPRKVATLCIEALRSMYKETPQAAYDCLSKNLTWFQNLMKKPSDTVSVNRIKHFIKVYDLYPRYVPGEYKYNSEPWFEKGIFSQSKDRPKKEITAMIEKIHQSSDKEMCPEWYELGKKLGFDMPPMPGTPEYERWQQEKKTEGLLRALGRVSRSY